MTIASLAAVAAAWMVSAVRVMRQVAWLVARS